MKFTSHKNFYYSANACSHLLLLSSSPSTAVATSNSSDRDSTSWEWEAARRRRNWWRAPRGRGTLLLLLPSLTCGDAGDTGSLLPWWAASDDPGPDVAVQKLARRRWSCRALRWPVAPHPAMRTSLVDGCRSLWERRRWGRHWSRCPTTRPCRSGPAAPPLRLRPWSRPRTPPALPSRRRRSGSPLRSTWPSAPRSAPQPQKNSRVTIQVALH